MRETIGTSLAYGETFQNVYGISEDHPFRVVWATCPPGHRECTATPLQCDCVQGSTCHWVEVKDKHGKIVQTRCGILNGNEYLTSGMYTLSDHEVRVLSFWNPEVYPDYLLRWRNNFVHEFGHALDDHWEQAARKRLQKLYVLPNYKDWLFDRGSTYDEYRQGAKEQGGFASPPWRGTWQQHAASVKSDGLAVASSELWADMYLGWVYNEWEKSEKGKTRGNLTMRLVKEFTIPSKPSENSPAIDAPTFPPSPSPSHSHRSPQWR